MTKREQLIDAIENSIVTNGIKGITADVVRNLLLGVVDLIPESQPEQEENSGSGQIIFYSGVPDELTGEYILTPEQQEHNAKMYEIVKNSDISLQVTVDISDYYKYMLQKEEGINAEGIRYNMLSIITAYLPEDLAAALGEIGGIMVLMESGIVYIQQDGSIVPAIDGQTE